MVCIFVASSFNPCKQEYGWREGGRKSKNGGWLTDYVQRGGCVCGWCVCSLSFSLSMDFKSFTALFLQQATFFLSRATCGLQRQKQTAVRTRTFQKRVECLDVCRWVPGLRSMHWQSVGATVGSNPPPLFFFSLYVRLLTENSWGANWAEDYLDATAQRTTGQKWRRDPKTQRDSWTGKTEVEKSWSEGKFQRTETQKIKIEASCSSCSLDRVAESLSSLSSKLLSYTAVKWAV